MITKMTSQELIIMDEGKICFLLLYRLHNNNACLKRSDIPKLNRQSSWLRLIQRFWKTLFNCNVKNNTVIMQYLN